MREIFVCALLVSFTQAEPGWNSGTAYTYNISSQSLSTPDEASNEYNGVIMKGLLELQRGLSQPTRLTGKLKDVQYAEIHTASPNECSVPQVQNSLSWQTFNTSNSIFDVILDNGVVQTLSLKKNITAGEANLIRAAVSQLQIDLQGKNAIAPQTFDKTYQIDKSNMIFSTMEQSIIGHCETVYDISRLPKYAIKKKSTLAPLLNSSEDHDSLIDIVKTSNFSNCKQHTVFHRGIYARKSWDAESSSIGNIISRKAEARIILNGTFENYTMHSSVIIEKILIAPSLYKKEKAMTMSCLNLTLSDMRSVQTLEPVLNESQTNLLYDYEYNSTENIDVKSSPLNNRTQNLNSETLDQGAQHTLYQSMLQHRKQRNVESSPPETNTTNVSSTMTSIDVTDALENTTDISVINTVLSQNDSSFQNSTYKINNTADKSDIKITSSTTEPLATTMKVVSTTPSSDLIIPNENVSLTFSNSTNKTSMQFHVNTTSAIQLLNMSKSLEKPLLSSFFTIYPSVQNKSILHPRQIQYAIKNISEEISSKILDFKTIINKNVLYTFSELIFLIANTEFEVLHNVSNALHEPQHSSENRRQLTWTVFRDAVSQAGTGPALMLIKEWILCNKITTNEAADIIDQLPTTVEIPNEHYIDSLFEMVKHPHIHAQVTLNVSMVLAFTNIVRQVLVDSNTRKALYPVHIFSPMVYNHTKLKEYFQYFQEQMENAVINEDSCKIHVYARAMGNLALPETLNIFRQYLKNNTKMTTFQRVLIVLSLDKIAQIYPAETQNFLFAIYVDENEYYEVRTAAVFQLMQTKPPVNVLKRIAEFTQFDSSNQVIAAVKSSILSAAQLTNSEDKEFRENAISVMHLLNSKNLGIHYSTNFLKSYILTQAGNVEYKNSISYIGSENTIAPKGLFVNFEKYLGGLSLDKEQYGVLFSDMKKISQIVENMWSIPQKDSEINVNNQFSNEENGDIHSENEFLNQHNTSANVSNSTDNRKKTYFHEDQDSTETMFLFHFANAEKFLTFGKNYSSSIQKWLQERMKSLETGCKFHYNKLFQREKILYAVPNVAGYVTQVIYKVPSIYHLTGKIKLNVGQGKEVSSNTLKSVPHELNLTGQFNLRYALNKHTNVGVVTPFNGKRYITGYKEQLLLNIPIVINSTAVSRGQWTKIIANFSPFSNDSTGFYSQFNSQTYRQHDTVYDVVIKQGIASTNMIQKRPPKQIIKKIGGVQFNMTVQPITNEYISVQRNDLFSFLNFWANQKSINNHNIIVTAKFPSPASSVTFMMQYGTLNDNVGDDASPHETSMQKHKTHRSSVKRIVSTKQHTQRFNKTITAEWSILFNQSRKPAYMVNVNYTWNEFTNNTKFMASLSLKSNEKNSSHYFQPMLTFDLDGVWAIVPIFNFSKALLVNPTSTVKAVILKGSSKLPVVAMKCNLQRTSERKAYVLEQQASKQCLEEMQDGNLMLPFCQVSSREANFLDQYNCSIQIDHLNEKSEVFTNAFQIIENLSNGKFVHYPRLHSGPTNQISLVTQFASNFGYVNISILCPKTEAKLKMVNIHSLLRPVVEIHPSQSAIVRIGQELLANQYYPTCVLDKNKINTFDNRTYTVKLGTCWYVLMALTLEKSANPRLSENDMLILARDNNEGRDIRLLFGDDVVDIASQLSSTKAKYIYVNNMPYRLLPNRFTNIILHSQNSNIHLQGTMMDDKIKLHFINISSHLVFDGIRVLVMTSNTYRNHTLGLCGTFRGEEYDFMLPNHCNVNDPHLLSASYAIVNNNTCLEQALEQANYAINKSCSVTSDIYLDTNFPKVTCPSYHNQESDPRCLSSYVQVQQNHRITCFSKNPLPKCKPSCYPITTVKKNVRFHCVATSVVSKHFVNAIKKGKLHDFSSKTTTKTITMDIPSGCYKC